jgi:hypothetical protein
MKIYEPFTLPPDLQRWGWVMSGLKSGPRRNPGGWFQFDFGRLHGIAKGDDKLDPNHPSLRVRVRCPTLEEAFSEAIRQMRDRSAALEKSEHYECLIEENRQLREDIRRTALRIIPQDWPQTEQEP